VCATQAGLDAVASGKTLLVVNGAAWVVGGVGLGLGAYFLLSGAAHPPATGLLPNAGPGHAGLSYRGSF
jgi:hypothetical protein